ncbi:MAG TPA: hypothetical protein VME41_07460 [Stellaceae bacterium]|nr:hypothetical protein [Stellaceae bacterium]
MFGDPQQSAASLLSGYTRLIVKCFRGHERIWPRLKTAAPLDRILGGGGQSGPVAPPARVIGALGIQVQNERKHCF